MRRGSMPVSFSMFFVKVPKPEKTKKKAAKKDTSKENQEPVAEGMDVEEKTEGEGDMDVDEKAEKVEAAEKPKKRKIEKVEKPVKDKKPQGPYFRWMNNTFRAQFKAENPDAKPTEVGKAAGEAWKEVSDELRAELKAEYDAEVVKYEEAHPEIAEAKKAKVEKEEKKDKKPQGAYFRWMNNTFRAQFKAENPDAKTPEVGKAAGEAWKEVSDELKAELTGEYESEMTAWRLRNGVPEPLKKEEKEEKAPKNILAMFIKNEFTATFKAENPEAKAAEINEAGATAFEALSEEDKAAWDAKYAAKLTELGIDRVEHDEKNTKAAKAKKAPKDAMAMFSQSGFSVKYLEENKEAKLASKEYKAALKTAWEELTEEVRGEWETKRVALCEELGVDPTAAAAAPSPDAKPSKPKMEKTKTWKELYMENQETKIKAKSPEKSEEDVEKEVNLRFKNASKSEKMMWTDKAKVLKAQAEKKQEAAMEEWNKAMEA